MCTFFYHLYSPKEATMNAMNDELPRIQEQVYYGHIQSHTDILEKFLSENSYKRYNPSVSTNISEKYTPLIFTPIMMLFSFRLLARMQRRNLFRSLHRTIRTALYLMTWSTYSLLEVCFVSLFFYYYVILRKDYCCSHIAVTFFCSYRWCKTCYSSTCHWSFIKSWNKIALWGHTLPGRCSRFLLYLFNVLFMMFPLTLSCFFAIQMDGSDRARVGLLLYVHTGGSSPILLLKDIFDRTISSFRFDPRTFIPWGKAALYRQLFMFLTFHTSFFNLI